jgi:hypothetical protein
MPVLFLPGVEQIPNVDEVALPFQETIKLVDEGINLR